LNGYLLSVLGVAGWAWTGLGCIDYGWSFDF